MPTLSFVEKVPEGGDVYTFRFQKPKHLKHAAGQHGIFMLRGLYRPHPFTLSSSPDEHYVAFSTRIRATSRFKQRLMQLVPGDTLYMLGPLLNFTFHSGETEYVFLAQGIGITPFRSMLVYAHSKNLPIRTTLIHVDNGAHTFKDITSVYATNAQHPSDPDAFRSAVAKQPKNSLFYISGSPGFIKATKSFLSDQGVAKHRIRTDSFLGY